MNSPGQEVETSLGEIESLLAKVGKALQDSEAEALQQASVQLRDAALRFTEVLAHHPTQAQAPAIAVRVRTVAVRLASQRDALARLSVLVERQVASVVPGQTPGATYGPRATAPAAAGARIYKAAG
ncbi:MAG: hypothetical protein ABS38_01700 [Acidovorax sp. SCN 68-22]|jgi:hypothetical protein|nr:hypothetical protein [Simplicispira sp.]ODS70972.1 MAG: hypothetical protein ABS38_01700 [Acidovorax sp. SCN 68-22]